MAYLFGWLCSAVLDQLDGYFRPGWALQVDGLSIARSSLVGLQCGRKLSEGVVSINIVLAFNRCHCRDNPALITNLIIYFRLFTIKDRCKTVRFQQTHNQSLRQLLLTVS